MQHNNSILGCKGTVPALRVYVLKKIFESVALLSLERTQVPNFATRVFGSYDCLVEFVLCHAALCFIREWRLSLAPSLACLLLVSEHGCRNPRDVDSREFARSRDAIAPRHRHTSRAQQAHGTRAQKLRYLAFRFWHLPT
jgi:hypothetical protein